MSNKKTREDKENMQDNFNESEEEEQEESGSERESDFDSDGNYVGERELQADFEGRNPEDCDFHGIKQLLRQLFLKANVDLGALTQIIISQNYVGSVVKQCLDGQDDDDDDEDDGSDGVFGITTIINITKRKNEPCIKQVRALLTSLADDNADDRTKAFVKQILGNDQEHVGLIINERMINIPAAISLPLFSSLQSELTKAQQKNMPYTFRYLVWISKTYNSDDAGPEVIFANAEEGALVDMAVASFEVDVTEQTDSSQWDYEGLTLRPHRKVLIFDGTKFNDLVKQMTAVVEASK
ncbi:protein BCCIP homolog [Anticarsia gemmatalis]|uniref:protein BCCIP homolog n=1 Tax=Anticarsia gemmatalis TaxID=129554 RepID=UPI003F774FB1